MLLHLPARKPSRMTQDGQMETNSSKEVFVKKILWIIALAVLLGGASFSQLSAQSITGTWQGALKTGPQESRIVVKISTTDKDKLAAVTYAIDQGAQPIPVSAFTRNGSTVKWIIAAIGGSYEGRVSGDGNSIEGIWNQGGQPAPLNLTKATPE